MKNKIIFKKIKKIYILGSTDNLINFVNLLKKKFSFEIFLHKKQSKEELIYSKKSLEKYLIDKNIKYKILKNLDSFEKQKKRDKWILLNFGSYFNLNKLFIKKNKDRLFNFMPTPLPKYRGGAHVTWAMMKNEKNWGSRIQEIDEYTKDGGFYDNGYILDSIDYKIDSDIKNPHDFLKCTIKNDKKLLTRFLNKITMQKKFEKTSINKKERIFFPRLNTKKNALIDWNWKLKDIVSFINSFSKPYIGASTKYKGKTIFLSNARVLEKEKYHPYQYGLIVNKNKNKVDVIVNGGLISILDIKNSKLKKILNKIHPGERFKSVKENLISKKFHNPNKKILLKGKKIYLRNLYIEDCNKTYLKWLNNRIVNKFLETRWKKQSLNSIKEFISNVNRSKDQHILGIFEIKTNKHVGNIKIFEINNFHNSAQIGYFIGEKINWGKGFSTEAIGLIVKYGFKNLKLKYINAIVYEKNVGSVKVLRKNRFKIDGKFLKKIVFKGKRCNELSMSINKK